MRAILRHMARRTNDIALVAERHDGLWASTRIELGSTRQVQRLTLSTALARGIKRLYEVDVSARRLRFSSFFETDAEGAVVEGEIFALWRVSDPVALLTRARFDHLTAIREAAEDILRPIISRVTVETVETLDEKGDIALAPWRPLSEGAISWGEGEALFRLTGLGALHRHSLESIRRARIVDREQRSMDEERINFYADVIQSGHVNLLAMMLSNNKADVEKVLNYVRTNEIPIGRAALSSEDPLRHAVNQMMNEADDFARQDMRQSLLNSWQTHFSDNRMDQLRDALGKRRPTGES
ncbi:SPFH domain-containing protein [Amycolatopsis sp.]|uniref:SPFH domain-containing protein n=1 Tax=Amycolatopsis sp. TaxID=37632 RepID=UPI002DFF7632|nr:hypothetical protein [Amycolatopsis sp.]